MAPVRALLHWRMVAVGGEGGGVMPRRDHTARVIVRVHALMQNIRRGHYELGGDACAPQRVATAFTELARAI